MSYCTIELQLLNFGSVYTFVYLLHLSYGVICQTIMRNIQILDGAKLNITF